MITVYDGVDSTGRKLATIEPTVAVTLFYGITLVTGLFIVVSVEAADFDVVLGNLDAPGSVILPYLQSVAVAAAGAETARAEAAEAAIIATAEALIAGAAIYHRLQFAYNTAGLAAGVALYTPTVGDILLDAWIAVDTVWDGTTPLSDFGFFENSEPGFLATIGTAISVPSLQDMTAAISSSTLGLGIDPAGNNDTAALSSYELGAQYVPGRFVTAHPICVCVSQTGLPGGASPGSTKGTASLYLITATPRST